ncbi:helix-turn-helix domain-containing protein [Halovivax gelatinilyticus]|uniref:helix-turn-helix domain-containing protein n=1 Tax=Halovivax gelatinilyticus TaxID=2961597 RepID=UPI0020CA744A|nr:helix-turn-helix domain-containing protein [Halovivax gelatinilyticus]
MSERNDRGTFSQTVSDESLLAYFSRADRPFQTARSIADHYHLDRSQAYRRLQQLADDGALEKAKVGGRAVVWWLADGENASKPSDVNTDDPIFERTTFEAGDPADTSERIDEILYGGAVGNPT